MDLLVKKASNVIAGPKLFNFTHLSWSCSTSCGVISKQYTCFASVDCSQLMRSSMHIVYMPVARGSPCVVWEKGFTINEQLYVISICVGYDSSQRWGILCKAVWWFKLLNALVASTRSTASDCSSWKTLHIAWMVASLPASWPAQSWRAPAAFKMSYLITTRMALSIILW